MNRCRAEVNGVLDADCWQNIIKIELSYFVFWYYVLLLDILFRCGMHCMRMLLNVLTMFAGHRTTQWRPADLRPACLQRSDQFSNPYAQQSVWAVSGCLCRQMVRHSRCTYWKLSNISNFKIYQISHHDIITTVNTFIFVWHLFSQFLCQNKIHKNKLRVSEKDSYTRVLSRKMGMSSLYLQSHTHSYIHIYTLNI